MHWAFDIMVGIGTLLMALVLWFVIAYWRRRDVPHSRIFLWVAAGAGVLTFVALEAGWIVTEVGRQPWIVYEIERTADAVTGSGGVWVSFAVVLLLYTMLGIATILVLRAMSRRWRRQDEAREDAGSIADEAAPYGPRPQPAAAASTDRAEP